MIEKSPNPPILNQELPIKHLVFKLPEGASNIDRAYIASNLQSELERYAKLASQPVQEKRAPDRENVYKYVMLDTLLEDGQIDSRELETKLRNYYKIYGFEFSPSVFNSAMAQVIEYARGKTIKLTENKILFENKLRDLQEDEYEARQGSNNVNKIKEYQYKIAILSTLLDEQSVNVIKIRSELASYKDFDQTIFNQAFKEVADFVESGGRTQIE